MPFQFGIVLTLAGLGFIYLRTSDGGAAYLVFGTLALTVGIGFIISAVASFMLARHLGLLPQTSGSAEDGTKIGTGNS